MSKPKLIGKGAFSCAFMPGFNCNGKTVNDKVTKVTSEKEQSKNEYLLGKIIKNVENYKDHFVVQESLCSGQVSSVLKTYTQECNFLQEKGNSDLYIMKSEYLNTIQIPTFFEKNNNMYLYVTFFHHIIKSIEILISLNIVHYDLHFGNLLLNKNNGLPVIIDFGLSFVPSEFIKNKKINYKLLNEKFYVYEPSWHNWCLEVHFINWFTNYKTKKYLTMRDIRLLISQFINKNIIMKNFSNSFKYDYEKSALEFFSVYANKPKRNVIYSLLKFWNTWDMYNVSVGFLLILKKYKRFNNFMNMFLKLLMNNINPNPYKRYSISQNIDYIKKIENIKIEKTTELDKINNKDIILHSYRIKPNTI